MTLRKVPAFFCVLAALLTFFVCTSLCSVACAAGRDITVRELSKKMSGKFGRGLVNAATGWGEMIRCPLEVGHERGALLTCTWGPLKGIAMTFFRTVGGVLETGLFFFPLPGNYDPYFESEFVFSKPVTEKPPLELP